MPAHLFGVILSLSILSKAFSSITDETFYCSTFDREEVLCTIEGPHGPHLSANQRERRRTQPRSMLPEQYLLIHWPSQEGKDRALHSRICKVTCSSLSVMELTDSCAFGQLLKKVGPGPLQMVKRDGYYQYIFDRTLYPDEVDDDNTMYNPRGEFGSVILSKLNPATPPWHCHTNKYEYVSDDPLISMHFRVNGINGLADCSAIEGTIQDMPPETTTIVGNWDERVKAFSLNQNEGGSGYAFFVERLNVQGKIDPNIKAVLVVRWKGMRIILRQRERRQ